MDPNLWLLTTHFLQQNQLVRASVARAERERDEQEYQARLLVERRQTLKTAQEDASMLAGTAATQPQQTFVKSQLILSSLDYRSVVPDSFDEQEEKEKVVLVWRKLANIAEKSKSNMTAEQMKACAACLDAIAMQNFIRHIWGRLEAHHKYQQIKPQWESVQRKHTRLTAYQKQSILYITVATAIAFLVHVSQVGFEQAAGVMVLWILAGVTLGLIVCLLVEARKPRDIEKIDSLYQQYSRQAQMGDTDFWQAVQERFDGIPTVEALQAIWNEQEQKVEFIFGKPTAEPEDEPE